MVVPHSPSIIRQYECIWLNHNTLSMIPFVISGFLLTAIFTILSVFAQNFPWVSMLGITLIATFVLLDDIDIIE